MTPDFDQLVSRAAEVVAALKGAELTLATAESCTGGLIAAVITEVPGSSDVFDRGFVTYSNAAKTDQLGVGAALIEYHGAVSEEVALAMAAGALRHSTADLCVAVTGIAGPGGGGTAKPVGLVHLAAAKREAEAVHRELRLGDIGRRAVRLASVAEAFQLIRALVSGTDAGRP